MLYIFIFIFLFLSMLIYFKIADKFNIIDKPNERSSHTKTTIRGGGIIFLISIIVSGILEQEYQVPVIGATIIGGISFLDDRITLSSRIRVLFHLVAVTLMFYFLPVFGIIHWWGVVILYVLVIGVINAYNFMDGINGITGLYSVVILGGLQYVNLYKTSFVTPDVIWLPMISCLVFLYFNFRKKAKCFAGDVGSVTMAFWIIMLILQLMIKTNNYLYILFLAVYGVDAVLTIIHRLVLKQNIFEAHRLHFYQILANDQKVPHLVVSSIYGVLQLLIIALIISGGLNFYVLGGIVLIPLILIYIVMKPKLMLKTA
ncbi:UDP-GlcNAc--UDP-phosphate GlcNAc-1-phosphate transferase [Pedobacter ginsengisoli]|uniref:UDP-GlcNAc--UDP-phosphate GlcNAc-1-phosphate transferase n=1 Tax=Pedobacter ginsengisoli TaxID=363852 RepID=A0A2D1U8P9_9SPHI|nr:glycosyltransferase family 4 protein [Pedobacter ginsengisoli]ATP57950.1 UDP-GlcNAc--UDP-phosphate GlcNAc-1-phosphate transferase [Pedobacter ginsengisoli]